MININIDILILTISILLVLIIVERYIFNKRNLIKNIKFSQTLGHVTALRDHGTGEHNLRVTYMASILGEDLGLNRKSLKGLMKGAFLHDIGKIGIPDSILLKNGKLDDKEWKIMKQHPQLGVDIVSHIKWFHDAHDVILYHHERFDGTGYPSGLSGENIPLNARIFALVDVFDALISKRPYKDSFHRDKAIEIIKDGSGTHFDPKLVPVFLKYAQSFADIIQNGKEQDIKEKLIKQRDKIFNLGEKG